MDLLLENIAGLAWGAFFRLVAVLYAAIVLHTLVTALLSWIFRVNIEEISIGALLPVFKMKIGTTILSLKAMPISGFVRYTEPEAAQATPIIQRDQSRYFKQLPTVLIIIIAIAGSLALLQTAIILIGKSAILSGFAVWGQFIAGALGPFSVAQTYLADLSSFIQSAPLETLIAVVFAKYGAINLLPLGGVNGGAIFSVFLRSLIALFVPLGSLFSGRAVNLYLQLSMILLLLLFLSWSVALFYFLF